MELGSSQLATVAMAGDTNEQVLPAEAVNNFLSFAAKDPDKFDSVISVNIGQ